MLAGLPGLLEATTASGARPSSCLVSWRNTSSNVMEMAFSSSSPHPLVTARRATSSRTSRPSSHSRRNVPEAPLVKTFWTPCTAFKRLSVSAAGDLRVSEIFFGLAQARGELFGCVFGHDTPTADDHDALAHGGGFGKNVGAQDDGMGSSQVLDQLSNLDNLFRIEPNGRFIQD